MDTPRVLGGFARTAFAVMMAIAVILAIAGCSSDDSGGSGAGGSSANVAGGINTAVTVGDSVITIKSLQAAFQPVAPAQRLSDEALVAPAAGVTFYQAYVHIENRGQFPLRVDPDDFVCQIGNVLSTIEPTRSGPVARSIIYGTSLDLLLTFRGATGADPTLIYNPPWYSGLITFSAGVTGQSASGAAGGTTTTTVVPITE